MRLCDSCESYRECRNRTVVHLQNFITSPYINIAMFCNNNYVNLFYFNYYNILRFWQMCCEFGIISAHWYDIFGKIDTYLFIYNSTNNTSYKKKLWSTGIVWYYILELPNCHQIIFLETTYPLNCSLHRTVLFNPLRVTSANTLHKQLFRLVPRQAIRSGKVII